MLAVIGINLCIMAMLALFSWRLYRRHGSFLQLGILFSLTLVLNYPLRILELLFFPAASRPGYPHLVAADNLRELSLMQIPGIMAFCLGYWIWERRVKVHNLLRRGLLEPSDKWDFGLLYVLYPISLAAKGVKVLTGNYVSFLIGENQNLSWANVVENLSMIGWTCLAGAWLLFFRGRIRSPIQMAFFALLNLLELLYQVIQGSKTFLLLPLYILLLTFYYSKERIPWKGGIAAVIFAAVIVFPFVSKYRDFFGSQYRGGIPSVQEFEAQRVIQDSYRESRDENQALVQSLLKMLGRFAGADEFYGLRKMVPTVMPYKHGHDFLAILYVPIPRLIWPDKPIFSPGAAYGAALGTITSVTPFPLGEMYWNFGGMGMVIGMLAWGALMAACMSLFDHFFKKLEYRFFVLAIFLSEAYWLTTGEGMLAMQIATVIKRLVLYVALYQGAKIFYLGLGGRILATSGTQWRTVLEGRTP